MYRVDAYFLTRQLAELPPFMISPLIFLSIFYFMMGLNPEIERFLVACGVVLLMVQVVMSFGEFIDCSSWEGFWVELDLAWVRQSYSISYINNAFSQGISSHVPRAISQWPWKS